MNKIAQVATILGVILIPFQSPASPTARLDIKAGDHSDFTRFVIYHDKGANWEGETAEGGFAVKIGVKRGAFDPRGLFEKISKKRVSEVLVDENGIFFRMDCECLISVHTLDSNKIVLDFIDNDVGSQFVKSKRSRAKLQSPHQGHLGFIFTDRKPPLRDVADFLQRNTLEFSPDTSLDRRDHPYQNLSNMDIWNYMLADKRTDIRYDLETTGSSELRAATSWKDKTKYFDCFERNLLLLAAFFEERDTTRLPDILARAEQTPLPLSDPKLAIEVAGHLTYWTLGAEARFFLTPFLHESEEARRVWHLSRFLDEMSPVEDKTKNYWEICDLTNNGSVDFKYLMNLMRFNELHKGEIAQLIHGLRLPKHIRSVLRTEILPESREGLWTSADISLAELISGDDREKEYDTLFHSADNASLTSLEDFEFHLQTSPLDIEFGDALKEYLILGIDREEFARVFSFLSSLSRKSDDHRKTLSDALNSVVVAASSTSSVVHTLELALSLQENVGNEVSPDSLYYLQGRLKESGFERLSNAVVDSFLK